MTHATDKIRRILSASLAVLLWCSVASAAEAPLPRLSQQELDAIDAYMSKQAEQYRNSEGIYYDPETGKPLPKGMQADENGHMSIIIDEPTPYDEAAAEERRKEMELIAKTYTSSITPIWQFQTINTGKAEQEERKTVTNKASIWALLAESRKISSTGIINAGTIIPGLLITGLNSSLPGELAAQVSEPVYDSPSGHKLLIPQGSRLFGKYDSKIIFGQKRALVRWERLIFPDGSYLDMNMLGGDKAGYSGFKGSVNNHYPAMFTSAAMISIFAGIAKEQTKDEQKITISQPTIKMEDSVPVGTVLGWPTDTPPINFLPCNGTNFDKTLYPQLYELLGTDTTPNYSIMDSKHWIIKARNRSTSIRTSGMTTIEDSSGNEIVGELADTISAMTEKIFEKYLELAPTLAIKPGYRFSIIVNKQMVLPTIR